MVTAFLGFGFFALSSGEDFSKVLRPVLTESFDLSAEMLVRSDGWDSESSLVKVTVVRNKGMKISHIHPSSMQGISILDNGRENQYYSADDNLLRTRRSFFTFWPTPDEMYRKAVRNYDFREVGRGTRLGHPVVMIEAKAKDSAMGKIRYTVGRSVPVAFEVVNTRGNQSVTTWRVMELDLGADDEFDIKLSVPPSAKRDKLFGPMDIQDIKFATGKLGFTPTVPTKLPSGFEIYAKQLVGRESDPFFAARLTDGLTMVHVYLWQYKKGSVSQRSDIKAEAIDKAKDVAIGFVGDVPDLVKKGLVRSFLSRTE